MSCNNLIISEKPGNRAYFSFPDKAEMKIHFLIYIDGPFIFFFHLQPQDGVRVFFPDIVDKFASDAGPTAGFLDINVLDPHAWPAKFCGKAFCDHAIALDLAGNLKI